MAIKISVFALLACGAAMSARAAVFPLERKTMTAEEALVCPGYGPGVALELDKPKAIAREPKAASKYPLYGVFKSGEKYALPFRVDESKGTGKGYDRLMVDLNGNGDLRDDPVSRGSRKDSPNLLPDRETVIFEPIELPSDKAMGPWNPRFGAVMYIRRDRQTLFKAGQRDSIGSIGLRAGCYLEATVDLNGVKEKIGLVDANCNLRIGDNAGIVVIKRGLGAGDAFNLQRGDAILRDRNGNGRIDFDLCESESEPFNDVICFGSKVYRMTVDQDLRSLHLEPHPDPVGQVAFVGHAETIRTVTLAREKAAFQWQPVTPAIVNGRAVVPVGKYHLFTCVVACTNGEGTIAMTKGQADTTKDVFQILPGKTATLRCGMPLELRIRAERLRSPGEDQAVTRTAVTSNPPLLLITVQIIGASGEKYYAHAKGADLTVLPPPPRFRILEGQGNAIASGQFEYG